MFAERKPHLTNSLSGHVKANLPEIIRSTVRTRRPELQSQMGDLQRAMDLIRS